MPKTWDRDSIRDLLATNDRAVERAMVCIFERQTEDEQSSDDVRHHNGMGFAGWSARSGSYYAKWVMSGRRLTGKHLDKARKIASYHAGQLAAVANEKAQSQV